MWSKRKSKIIWLYYSWYNYVFSLFKATPISTTGEWFYEGFIFVRSQKMGGWVTGKIDAIMLLIRTSWDKSTKCEVIKCTGQKQSKGYKKWIPNRTPNKPVNSYHSYDLTSKCLSSAHILSVYAGLIFTGCFYVTHNIWQQRFKTNRTVTFLIISLKSEMLWGVGVLNNLQYALESVDGYRPGKVWKKHPL